MGFPRSDALAALAAAGGDLSAAAASLAANASGAEEPMQVEGAARAPAAAAAPPTAAAAAAGGACVQEAIVLSIGHAVAAAAAGGGGGCGFAPHDVVLLAAHALLASGGFVPAPSGDGPATGPEGGAAAGLPRGWCSRGGMLALSYSHERRGGSGAPLLEVRAVAMGSSVLLHAMLQGGGPQQLVSVQVDASRVSSVGAAAAALAPLRPLLHLLGTRLLQPLLCSLRATVFDPSGAGAPTELVDLCPELQLAILAHLPAAALCRAASVSRSFASLAADDAIWRELFRASFGDLPPRDLSAPPSAAGPSTSAAPPPAGGAAKRAYAARLDEERTAAAEKEKRRRLHEQVLRDGPPWYGHLNPPPGHFNPPGPLPVNPGGAYPGGLPVPLPGFVGGDFDRTPGFGPLHGGAPGFGPPPGFPGMPGAGNGRGMQPRYDPIGGGHDPLVDPDGISGVGGGIGGVPMGPGRGGRGRGRGGRFPGGGMWDPDGPGFDPRFL
mmetsp:Transcript_41984/g.136223  ORF Transcript_41984/g.136223 Transcript_41984/m.136223 type:complete len:495 (+) Transcript_41984:2-1486(+)